MSANEQMAAAEGLGFVPYTRPTGTDTAEPLKIGVLISGSGTNLQALIDLIAAGKLNASIELVVSSRPSAKGLQRAERAGIQTLTLHLLEMLLPHSKYCNFPNSSDVFLLYDTAAAFYLQMLLYFSYRNSSYKCSRTLSSSAAAACPLPLPDYQIVESNFCNNGLLQIC